MNDLCETSDVDGTYYGRVVWQLSSQEFFSAPFQKTLALVDEQKKALCPVQNMFSFAVFISLQLFAR